MDDGLHSCNDHITNGKLSTLMKINVVETAAKAMKNV
jgi:hypothetical protein